MKQTYQPILTTTITAAADLEHEKRFIGFDGNYCGDGAKALGVLSTTFAKGEFASVDAIGIVLVEAGDAIAVGQEVTPDAQARAVPIQPGKWPGGWALDAASGAGQIIRIARGI